MSFTGPPRLPIFGAYLFLLFINKNQLHRATEYLSKIYKSTIVGFYYGPLLGVTIHDLKTCKEVMNNPDFDGRPLFEIVRARDPEFNLWGICLWNWSKRPHWRTYIFRNIFYGWFLLEGTATLHIEKFERFWIRTSFWWARESYQRWALIGNWRYQKWTKIQIWGGLFIFFSIRNYTNICLKYLFSRISLRMAWYYVRECSLPIRQIYFYKLY